MEEKVSDDMTKTVIHLSNIELNKAEQKILSLGLSYCPQSIMNYAQTRVNIYKFV